MATQTVTVLFTDLVGSTELSSRLGPDGTEALRQTHFGLLRGAIESAGGTEVKNLGDGVMVAFTSLSRALACSVAMQQAIERHNRRGTDPELGIRIGIATGEATEEDGDFFGDPVVEAARLCGLASGGQILATEVVKLMAGRHATQEFVAVGDLELKGIPEPVPSVEVSWVPSETARNDGERAPLPGRLVGASTESLFAFFGRADELARLDQARKAAASEHRLRVTLISGEPGMGKTTLVAQAARTAHGTGTDVLYGGCEEDLAVPYQPWISALSQLIDHADEGVLSEFVDVHGAAVSRLIPGLARRLSIPVPDAGNDQDAERFLILDGIARLLAAVSDETPVMLVLDDLHWVDASSLQLLRHLVSASIPMSVHVVGTYRESDLSRSHPLVGLLAHLRREPGVDRVELGGLTDVDIVDLLGAAAGHEVAEEGVALAHALRRETAGNPFFLVEVIRHLGETGAFIQDDAGHWVLAGDLADIGLPSSVREVVANRVTRLGEDTERALSMAAVVGREFDLDLLAGLLDEDEDRLVDLLDGAMGAGLISVPQQLDGRYRFVHALIQHTLYQDLSGPRRQRAHQRIAEALEARTPANSPPVEELARHWLAATRPHDASKALLYARRAGDAALAAYAPLDAVNWYTQALELFDRQTSADEHGRCELLTSLGGAQRLGGLPEHRDTLRSAGRIAQDLGDRDLLVAVALSRTAGIETSAAADPDRVGVLEAALDAVGLDDSTDRARLLASLAEETDPREVSRRVDLATEAIAVARRLGDDPTLLWVLALTANALSTPDTLDQRTDLARLARELSDRSGDASDRMAALYYGANASAEHGCIDDFDAVHAEMQQVAEATNLPYLRYVVTMTRAWRQLLAGRTAEAAIDTDDLLDLGTKLALSHAEATYGAQVLQRTTQQGGLSDIIGLVEQAAADTPTIPGWRPALMMMYSELGRFAEADELFEIGARSGFSDMPFDITWLQVVSQYGDVAADIGRVDHAPLLYDRLLPYASRFIFLGAIDWGSVSRSLGRLATLLGRYDDAEQHLADALAVHERIPAPFLIARTQLDQAELCLTRQAAGDEERAEGLIERVRQAIDQYGYHGLQPRLDRLPAGR